MNATNPKTSALQMRKKLLNDENHLLQTRISKLQDIKKKNKSEINLIQKHIKNGRTK